MTFRLVSQSSLKYVACVLWALALFGCCGSGGMPEQAVADTEAAYSAAEQAFNAGNFAAAVEQYTVAIEGGGLRSEMLAEAYIHRAIASAETGDFTTAMADLAMAEQGAPQPEDVHVARGIVLARQGKSAEANAEFKQAQALNPRIEIPAGE